MTETEKAYLAGIIDGEGTVTLTRRHRNRMPSPQLSVSSTDLTLLEYIQQITQAGRIQAKKKRQPHHRQSWHWQTHCVSDVLRILGEVKPFLRVKQQQAQLIVRHYQALTPRNGRYTPRTARAKMHLVERVQSLNKNEIMPPIIRQAPFVEE